MPCEYKEHKIDGKGTGIYVLYLEGNTFNNDELRQLNTTVIRIKEDLNIKKLIIHQEDENFRINSDGLKRIISMGLSLIERTSIDHIKFSNLSGKCKKLIEMTKLDTKFVNYGTLEQAIESYE